MPPAAGPGGSLWGKEEDGLGGDEDVTRVFTDFFDFADGTGVSNTEEEIGAPGAEGETGTQSSFLARQLLFAKLRTVSVVKSSIHLK